MSSFTNEQSARHEHWDEAKNIVHCHVDPQGFEDRFSAMIEHQIVVISTTTQFNEFLSAAWIRFSSWLIIGLMVAASIIPMSQLGSSCDDIPHSLLTHSLQYMKQWQIQSKIFWYKLSKLSVSATLFHRLNSSRTKSTFRTHREAQWIFTVTHC